MPRKGSAKLRVLLAGHLPPPVGGIATYYAGLLGSSLPARVDLSFVQTSTHNRSLSQTGRASVSNLVAAARDCTRFARAVREHRPEICHIGTAFGLSFVKHALCVLIARISGSRVLLHPHCSLSALYTHRPAWWRWLFRRVIALTDGVIALSGEWMQLSRIAPGIPIYALRNSINLAPYQEIARQRVVRAAGDRCLQILYLGSIGRDKGSFDLLEAARQFSSAGARACFHLVGSEMSPGECAALHRRIEAENLSKFVQVHPPTYGEEKLACLRSADIFVYPSYHEGMPMAVIEAMASGLPIVATRVGGLPDLVEVGANGALVEPKCPDQLAGALLRIAADPEMIRSMQQNSSRIAAARFDIEQHVSKLVEIYAQAV